MRPHPAQRQSGFSLVETLAMLSMMGMVMGMGGLYLKPAEAPIATSEALVEGAVRMVRARAIATTSAIRLTPSGTSTMVAETASDCFAASWTVDPDLEVELPDDVQFTDVLWSVCFTSRGLASSNTVIPFGHPEFGASGVEILLGGSTRIVP